MGNKRPLFLTVKFQLTNVEGIIKIQNSPLTSACLYKKINKWKEKSEANGRQVGSRWKEWSNGNGKKDEWAVIIL